MSAPYRLYGAELSPYSQKVRAYLAFKGLSFDWIARTHERQEEFQRYAKLPLMPVLVGADNTVRQDSTPIIEALEQEANAPTLQPEDASLAFISALIEDYADEWLNKAMFHHRWSTEADRDSAARRLVDGMFDGDAPNREALESAVRDRMVSRLRHVGSTPETAESIETSFHRLASFLERHFAGRSYLFGGRPCLADFGLAAQLGQMLTDPTPGAYLRAEAPRVTAWIERMQAPKANGVFESFEELRNSLAEFLSTEIANLYLPWMAANAEAVANDFSPVQLELDGRVFTQTPQRYAAKAMAEIRRKRADVDDDRLTALLAETRCEPFLGVMAEPPADGGDEGEDDEGEA